LSFQVIYAIKGNEFVEETVAIFIEIGKIRNETSSKKEPSLIEIGKIRNRTS